MRGGGSTTTVGVGIAVSPYRNRRIVAPTTHSLPRIRYMPQSHAHTAAVPSHHVVSQCVAAAVVDCASSVTVCVDSVCAAVPVLPLLPSPLSPPVVMRAMPHVVVANHMMQIMTPATHPHTQMHGTVPSHSFAEVVKFYNCGHPAVRARIRCCTSPVVSLLFLAMPLLISCMCVAANSTAPAVFGPHTIVKARCSWPCCCGYGGASSVDSTRYCCCVAAGPLCCGIALSRLFVLLTQ